MSLQYNYNTVIITFGHNRGIVNISRQKYGMLQTLDNYISIYFGPLNLIPRLELLHHVCFCDI